MFLTRSGSESDLVDELGDRAEMMAEGVVIVPRRRRYPDGTYEEPGFARQGLALEGIVEAGGPEEIADALASAMRARQPRQGPSWRWTLQVVAADARDPHDPRRGLASALSEVLPDALRARLPRELRSRESSSEEAERIAQVWIPSEEAALIGLTVATSALTRDPAGKPRLRRPANAVSRSGLKLEEALRWLGVGPEKGELCADLGAAPGGWTQVALTRGARVIAVDPARLRVSGPRGGLTHIPESAFTYVPEETLDWLLCDMAWRPLEVAQLLAKWGRRGWARQTIVNIKLPMKRKAAMLRQVIERLASAGWQGIRKRQLFHDRDEITLAAWLDPSLVMRGPQPAFQVRAQRKRSGPKSRATQTRKGLDRRNRSSHGSKPPTSRR